MVRYSSSVLKTLDERGLIYQGTKMESLDEKLAQGPATLYIGIDPTSPSLHCGYLIPLRVVGYFLRFGHRVLVVIGDGTAAIGDPTGKDKMRPMMTGETIADNAKKIARTVERLVHPSAILFNESWLSPLSLMHFLRSYGPHLSVNRYLGLEAMKTRLNREEHLSFLEFFYPALQAYDFLHLAEKENCVLQCGGADQWGNIVLGAEQTERLLRREVFGLTFPLLLTASGKKMGKTEEGAVSLELSPYALWQFFRNVDDGEALTYLKCLTDLPLEEVEATVQADVNGAKKLLATEVVAFIHGREEAEAARARAEAIFERGNLEEIPVLNLPLGTGLVRALVAAGQAKTNGQARRLIAGGAVKINGEREDDERKILSGNEHVTVGKKRHFRVHLS